MITLTKEEAIEILQVLSRIDGFIISIDSDNKDNIFNDLHVMSEILAEKIKDDMS